MSDSTWFLNAWNSMLHEHHDYNDWAQFDSCVWNIPKEERHADV